MSNVICIRTRCKIDPSLDLFKERTILFNKSRELLFEAEMLFQKMLSKMSPAQLVTYQNVMETGLEFYTNLDFSKLEQVTSSKRILKLRDKLCNATHAYINICNKRYSLTQELIRIGAL